MNNNSSKKIKVAVIGGGPSGLSAAEYIREISPHIDITIYERNHYFGGKCCTVLAEGTIANGRPGGYEMGAGVFTPNSRLYKDTEKLLEKYNLKTDRALPPGLKPIEYLKDGQDAWHETHPVSLYNLFKNPGRFFRGFYGFMKFGIDIIRFQRFSIDLAGRPKKLAQTMSERYPAELNRVLALFMQGYGYAHEPDPGLTPPMLYYHQYMQPDMTGREKINIDKGMEKRLYKLVTGTQGIWQKVAESFSDNRARLNSEVINVKRLPDGVEITTAEGTEEYDYAVVAAPFKQTLKFMDYSDGERELVAKMQYNHYVTVLCKAEDIEACCTVNVPVNVDRHRYGDLLLAYRRYADTNILIAYLYIKPGTSPSDSEIIDRVEAGLRDGCNGRLIEKSFAKVFHWDDYFGHLGSEDILDDWYGNFNRTIQGKDNTLFVSSGLHMETVGSSVQYSRWAVKKYFQKWFETQSR